MSYSEIIINHKAELLRLKAEGEALDAELIFAPVDWTEAEATKAFCAWVLKQKLASRSEIKAQRARSQVIKVLGQCPATPCQYAAAFADLCGAAVTYDGQISVLDDRGARSHKIITAYQTEARVFAAEYGLPFSRESINDAVEVWHETSRLVRLDVIREKLTPSAAFDWVELGRRAFDCSEMSAELVAAILQKFVHQTKRKLAGLLVGNHLMPVILGKQGCGKSWFMHWLTNPLAEFRRDTDFKAIGDERNIGLWASYVLIVDEMAYADRSDMETVKHVITADVLDRRPMRRNDAVRVRQSATLIGASNKSIGELIRDETGSRRFAGIHFREDADRDYLNSLNALDAWRSVSTDGPDPMDGFRAELLQLQAHEQYVSPVEEWLKSLTARQRPDLFPDGAAITSVSLYQHFLEHFRARNDGMRPKTMSAWQQEVGRLLKAGVYAIEKHRTSAGMQWRWRDLEEAGR